VCGARGKRQEAKSECLRACVRAEMEAFVAAGSNGGVRRAGAVGARSSASARTAGKVAVARRKGTTVRAVVSVERPVTQDPFEILYRGLGESRKSSSVELLDNPVEALNGPRELTDAIMAARDHTAVVMFRASHCRSCKAVLPRVQKLAQNSKYASAKFYTVDVSANEELGRQLGIDRLPTFQFYVNRDGHPGLLDEFACGGFECAHRLKRRLDRFATAEFDPSEYEF